MGRGNLDTVAGASDVPEVCFGTEDGSAIGSSFWASRCEELFSVHDANGEMRTRTFDHPLHSVLLARGYVHLLEAIDLRCEPIYSGGFVVKLQPLLEWDGGCRHVVYDEHRKKKRSFSFTIGLE